MCFPVPVMMEGSLYMIPETLQQISAGPTNPSVFSSACDDGRLLIYDPRDSTADKCQPYQSMCVFQCL